MTKVSAGLLMYRFRGDAVEVLLVHPGGPFFSGKDEGVWSIPKGEVDEGEHELAAALREFQEETGFPVAGPFTPLTPVKQKGGKIVKAWAFEGDCDPELLKSNMFRLEWPPRSGRLREFPEVDRAAWFSLDEGRRKINPAQIDLLEELRRQARDRSFDKT